jgi:hypothetical protein
LSRVRAIEVRPQIPSGRVALMPNTLVMDGGAIAQ